MLRDLIERLGALLCYDLPDMIVGCPVNLQPHRLRWMQQGKASSFAPSSAKRHAP
jgi:hypothetical protein